MNGLTSITWKLIFKIIMHANPEWKEIHEIMHAHPAKIFEQDKGILYCIILHLFDEFDGYTPQKNSLKSPATKAICDKLNIKGSNTMNEDIRVAEEVIKKFIFENHQNSLPQEMAELANSGTSLLTKLQNLPRELQILALVIAGALLVGAYFYLAYIHKNRLNKNNIQNRGVKNTNQQEVKVPERNRPIIPADLYLVVPASVASQFSGHLTTTKLKELIDNASYFKCVNLLESEHIEKHIELEDRIPEHDSQKEFCLKIKISDGENLISSQTRYELKNSLEPSSRYEIKKKSYLKSLSGLKMFVRI